MKQFEACVKDFEKDLFADGFRLFVSAEECRFDELDIPVAEFVPEEVVDRSCRVVEPHFVEVFADFLRDILKFREDPLVCKREVVGFVFDRVEIEFFAVSELHEAESRRVVYLVDESPVAFEPFVRKFYVASCERHHREGEAESVRAVFFSDYERIDDVSFALRHLLAEFVADKTVEKYLSERFLAHELVSHHYHSRNPEENDVEACFHKGRRVIFRKFRRFFGPA